MIHLDEKKISLKKYIIAFFIVLFLSIITFIILKYYVEGEKNLPFNIKQIVIISTAETDELEQNENLYQANIIQKNDLYITIQKNENYKKQEAIRKITINNFNIIDAGKVGTLKIYRTANEGKKYIYNENYEISNDLDFFGDLNTNLQMEKMTIANQGDVLEYSIILNDLGKITYGENENIISDGTLLNRLNLTAEDLRTKISFDLIIEVSSGNKYKTTIVLNLPEGNIDTQGVCTNENIDVNKLVFKRL